MAAVHYGSDDEAAPVQPDLVRPAQREIGEPHAEPGIGLVALQPLGAWLRGSQPVEGGARQQRLELIQLLARRAEVEQQSEEKGVPPVPRGGAAEPGAVAPVRAFEADPLSDRRMVLGVVVVEFLFARRNPAVNAKRVEQGCDELGPLFDRALADRARQLAERWRRQFTQLRIVHERQPQRLERRAGAPTGWGDELTRQQRAGAPAVRPVILAPRLVTPLGPPVDTRPVERQDLSELVRTGQGALPVVHRPAQGVRP